MQVTGRLLTGNDEVAASVTRPWLLPYRSPFSQRIRYFKTKDDLLACPCTSRPPGTACQTGLAGAAYPVTRCCRSIWRMPLSLVGYHRRHKLQMQLFKAQRESLTEPFVRFQAGLQVRIGLFADHRHVMQGLHGGGTLSCPALLPLYSVVGLCIWVCSIASSCEAAAAVQARANGGSLPRVQKAKVTVQLHLGWLLRLLYLVCPSSAASTCFWLESRANGVSK